MEKKRILIIAGPNGAGKTTFAVELSVSEGGHDIPEPTIRRRYAAGLENLKNIYKPLVDEGQFM